VAVTGAAVGGTLVEMTAGGRVGLLTETPDGVAEDVPQAMRARLSQPDTLMERVDERFMRMTPSGNKWAVTRILNQSREFATAFFGANGLRQLMQAVCGLTLGFA
jgi:hypothetical protein